MKAPRGRPWGRPTTAQMNGTRKYVVSTTLTDPAWENCTVVSGDVKAEIDKLKQD
jgi:hypothetical protein